MLEYKALIFILLVWLPSVAAIGLSIPPVLVGDKKRYSSPLNLLNCVSYLTSKDDIVTVTIKTGGRLTSQVLNLNVFDSQKNTLRSLEDLSGDQIIMFTNLDYEMSAPDKKKRRLLEFHGKNSKEDEETMYPPIPEMTYVHICYDNIYSDKSWSFQKQTRDLTMTVDIRSLASLKKTNYKMYAKYFGQHTETAKMRDDLDFEFDFSEESFESVVKKLEHLLNEVNDQLKDSHKVVENLKHNERRLRDLNEEIFENYIKTTTLLLFTIGSLGIIQIIYFKFYFKRRKLI